MNIHRQLHNLTFIVIIIFFFFFLAGFRTTKVPVGNTNGMTKKKQAYYKVGVTPAAILLLTVDSQRCWTLGHAQ